MSVGMLIASLEQQQIAGHVSVGMLIASLEQTKVLFSDGRTCR